MKEAPQRSKLDILARFLSHHVVVKFSKFEIQGTFLGADRSQHRGPLGALILRDSNGLPIIRPNFVQYIALDRTQLPPAKG